MNKITHKHVVAEIDSSLSALENKVKACVIDAPLLIEADLCSKCDLTLSVIASKEIRAERISQRDGIDMESALRRINSQKKDEYYINNTDYSILNDGDLPLLIVKVEKIMRERGMI